MSSRYWLLVGMIVVASAAPAQAQGLLEKLGKLAREAAKNAAEPPAEAAPPADAPAGGPGYLGLTLDEPTQGVAGAPVLRVRDGSPAASLAP